MALPTFSFGAPPSTTLSTGQEVKKIVGEKFDSSRVNDDGTMYLPAWMQVVNPATGMVSQQSATTLQNYPAHSARAYSQSGAAFGLLAEPLTPNLVTDSDFNNWTKSGTPLINSITGPDGSTGDYEVEDDSGALAESISLALTPGVVAQPHTLSAWRFLTAPTPTTRTRLIYFDGANDPTFDATVVDTDWTFVEVTVANIDDGSMIIAPRHTTVADLGAVGWFGIQFEERSYPTSFFADSRTADIIRAAPKAVMNEGLFTIVMTYRPHYAETETTVDHNLLYFDVNNRVYFRQSDQNIVMLIDGVELAVGALTFSRHQEITVRVEHSNRRTRLTVTGATTGDGDIAGDVQALTREPTWVYILGGPTGSEEGADLTAFNQDFMTFCDLILCRMLIQMDKDPGARDFYEYMCALSEERARMYDVCLAMMSAFEIATAIGDQLDIIGSIVGLSREGAVDATYRSYLEIQVELLLAGLRDDAEWTGTIENILRITRKFIGPVGGTILYTGVPPYNFSLSLPVTLTVTQTLLLMRFISTAIYAGVLGFVQFPLSADTWGSPSVAVATAGVWGSASVAVGSASIWDLAFTTS